MLFLLWSDIIPSQIKILSWNNSHMYIFRKITLILLTFTLVGCMNNSPEKFEYKVLTVQDVETILYSKLMKAGAASPVEGQPGKLRITDIEQAKSENSMPIVLNNEGSEGWELTAINNSQLYIFQRPSGQNSHDKWQYKVLTIADIDTLIFSRLVAQKAAEPIPGQPGKFKILDVNKAKSQVIMAEVMTALGKEGWVLSGVNKSDLYIFKKQGPGATAFNKVAKATASAAPASTTSEPAKVEEAKPVDSASVADAKEKPADASQATDATAESEAATDAADKSSKDEKSAKADEKKATDKKDSNAKKADEKKADEKK